MNQLILNGAAAGSVSVFTAVIMDGGTFEAADPLNATHAGRVVGVAMTSATNGPIVVLAKGELQGGSFEAGARYYVGANGSLAVAPLVNGAAWSQAIGIGKNNGTLIVDIQSVLVRA